MTFSCWHFDSKQPTNLFFVLLVVLVYRIPSSKQSRTAEKPTTDLETCEWNMRLDGHLPYLELLLAVVVQIVPVFLALLVVDIDAFARGKPALSRRNIVVLFGIVGPLLWTFMVRDSSPQGSSIGWRPVILSRVIGLYIGCGKTYLRDVTLDILVIMPVRWATVSNLHETTWRGETLIEDDIARVVLRSRCPFVAHVGRKRDWLTWSVTVQGVLSRRSY